MNSLPQIGFDDDEDASPVRARSEGRSILTALEIAMALMLVWAGVQMI